MAARKSILYLNAVIPVTVTRDDLVREKLKPGKYFFTTAGFIKIVGMLCLGAAECILIVSDSFCDTVLVYKKLLLASYGITFVSSLLLYLIFCFGLTVKRPEMWVKIDIISNMLLSFLTIGFSALATARCKSSGPVSGVPPPLGIAGGIILIISCAAMFLLYRYREDEDDEDPATTPKTQPPRKSVFA